MKTRNLKTELRLKQKLISRGKGFPGKHEGRDGDISIRFVRGRGLFLFYKWGSKWYSSRMSLYTPQNSERTLGWDTPSKNGKSTAGDYFSNKTYGHLGFTGTSLWIDPEKDIIVILLTNRVHPTRNKEGIYQVRRDFHNSLMEIIGD